MPMELADGTELATRLECISIPANWRADPGIRFCQFRGRFKKSLC